MIWYVIFQTSVKQRESSLLLKLGFFNSWFVESRPDLVDCSYLEQDTVLNVCFYIQKTLLIVFFSYLNECDFQSASDCMWGLTTIPVGQRDETPGSSLAWFVTISFDLLKLFVMLFCEKNLKSHPIVWTNPIGKMSYSLTGLANMAKASFSSWKKTDWQAVGLNQGEIISVMPSMWVRGKSY